MVDEVATLLPDRIILYSKKEEVKDTLCRPQMMFVVSNQLE
jgi:hypothetical protein